MTESIVQRAAPTWSSQAIRVIHEKAEQSVQAASEIVVSADQLKAERFIETARRYVDTVEGRVRQHGKLEQAFSDLKRSKNEEAGPLSFDARKFSALQEELAAVALHDITNRPREDAARYDLFRLAKELGLTPQSAVTPSSGTEAESPISLLSDSDGGQNLGEVWKQLADAIGKSQQNDVDPCADAMKKYTDLYEKITAILGKLDGWMRADGDDKVRFDFKDLEEQLSEVLKDYEKVTYDPDKMIANGLSEEDAAALCKKLGISEKDCVIPGKDGKYCVRPDISQLQDLKDNLPPKGGTKENDYSISLGTFNIWKSGFDAQIRRIEDATQRIGENASRSYSRFENFHKTISTIIQSMVDMLKQYLQF